ncbi:protein turtle-like [Sarcoptes scabiei]|nr:protein turtle-like [Sarcoptes scabiei]
MMNNQSTAIDLLAQNDEFKLSSIHHTECRIGVQDDFDRLMIESIHLPRNSSSKFENDSCVSSHIIIKRNINYYVIRYYLPTFLQVCISQVEFWYPIAAYSANGRMVLTVVVMVNLIGISRKAYNLVPSRHITPLFWWLWLCQLFVFLSLLEFALAYAWYHFNRDRKLSRLNQITSPDGLSDDRGNWLNKLDRITNFILTKIYGKLPFDSDEENRNKVDYLARFMFPSVFLLTSVTYGLIFLRSNTI